MSTIFVAKVTPEEPEQGLMNQAIAFFNAGSRCMADVSITPKMNNAPMAPAIVCYAFSAELFLKLLYLIVVGSPEKIHGLKEIFDSLPEEIRRKVSERYRGGKGDIEADINSVSSAFVDWRYLHEQEKISINPPVLINIATAVYIVCRELRPNIRVFGENSL